MLNVKDCVLKLVFSASGSASIDYGSVSDYASNSLSASAGFDYGDVSDYVSNRYDRTAK